MDALLTLETLSKDFEIMKLRHSALTLKFYNLKKKYKALSNKVYTISEKQNEMEEILYADEDDDIPENSDEIV